MGPAMAPSLVTWPMRKVATPVSLACCTRRKAVSRTWFREPGADGDGGGVHGLDRVQGQEGRLDLFHHLEDVFQAGFRGHQQLGRLESQAVGPKFELDLGFFPGNVEADKPPPAEPVQDLEDEGGLADARVAAHQDHGALDHGASQGAVEFADAGDPAHLRGGFKVEQGLGLAASGGQLARRSGPPGPPSLRPWNSRRRTPGSAPAIWPPGSRSSGRRRWIFRLGTFIPFVLG